MDRLDRPATQSAFAEIIGVSQQAVSDMVARGVLPENSTNGRWNLAYCAHLREQAAGRQVAIDVGLTAARADLARAQAKRVEMMNEQTMGILAPVTLLEEVLARAASTIAGIFDGIPGAVRRRMPSLPAEALVYIEEEIARARNTIAAVKLDDLAADLLADPEDEVPPESDGEADTA